MKPKVDFSLSVPRVFTYDQLVKLSDENVEVFNRNIDPTNIDKHSKYVLTPIMIHEHAFGEPVDPHLRTFVINQSDRIPCGYQDLTFDQFRTGKLVA